MSLRDLAREVGLQVGSLYNHIESKQALLFALMREHQLEVLAACKQAQAGLTDPVERLEAFAAFHVTYHIARKREVYVSNSEMRSLESGNYAAIVAGRRDYELILIRILEDGKRTGLFRSTNMRLAAFGLLAMLTGVCIWYSPDGPLSAKTVTTQYVQMSVASVLKV